MREKEVKIKPEKIAKNKGLRGKYREEKIDQEFNLKNKYMDKEGDSSGSKIQMKEKSKMLPWKELEVTERSRGDTE